MSERPTTAAATDAYIGEIVRAAADVAPPAPAWDELRSLRQPASNYDRAARPRQQFAFAAAILAVLVLSGTLLWNNRDSTITSVDEPPASTTAPTTAPPTTSPVIEGSWFDWRDATGPAQVQLCLTRAVGTIDQTTEPPEPTVGADLPGYSPEYSYASRFRWSQSSLDSVYALLPEQNAAAAAGTERQAAAFAEMDAELSSGGQATSDQIEPKTKAYIEARDSNPLLDPDPEGCWFDSPTADGSGEIDAYETNAGSVLLRRCLLVAQFDHALQEAPGGEAGWQELTELLATAIAEEFSPKPPDILTIVSEVRAAALDQPADATVRLDSVRDLLRLTLDDPMGISGCPILEQ